MVLIILYKVSSSEAVPNKPILIYNLSVSSNQLHVLFPQTRIGLLSSLADCDFLFQMDSVCMQHKITLKRICHLGSITLLVSV